jgi:hypothetical protein
MVHSVLLTTLLAAPFASVPAQEPSGDEIRELDELVQDAKAEALDIAAELNRLERRLVYPSATRLTLTFAAAGEKSARLNAIEVRIDGEIAAQYVYSPAELEALRNGGVQTLYTGNVTSGQHEVNVRITGTLENGASFEETGRHVFTKGADARTLDIKFDGAGRERAAIRIADR